MKFDRENQEGTDKPIESLRERSLRERKKRKSQGKNIKTIVICVVVLCILGIMIGAIVKKCSSSRVVMDLNEYYDVPKDKVMLVFHDVIKEEMGILEGGRIYLPYDLVTDNINKRFYFDSSENILSFTNATEIIRTEVGSKDYYINKSKITLDYPIVKAQGEDVYLALDYIEMFSNIEYKFYENPNRIMIESQWGEKYSYYKVKKSGKMRFAQSKKSEILASLEEGDILRVLASEEELLEGYAKAMTVDGVYGYVSTKILTEPYEEKLTNDYKEEMYPHITKDEPINLVWHQVTNLNANNELLNKIATTKGVNCISPTWFSIVNNSGEISSLASETYVERAHNEGIEVWALCDDFAAAGDEVDLATVLGNTTSRDKLSNALLANAIQYNLDGINIDFEYIRAETADAYLEFLRELSVKCRNNGIVLSVDSYVPTEYTAFYDREEQGKVVDYVVVMAYDEHYAGSKESGSVASIGFVEDAVGKIVEMVDPSQVIIGMPFYTRLWKETTVDGETKVSSSAYSMGQIEAILEQNNASKKWDNEIGQYYAEYEADGSLYRVWIEDERSIEKKLDVIFAERKQGKIAGIASWKLGLEKESIWNSITKYIN